MTRFVQERVDVPVRAGGIHEDEGEAALVKADLVAAGGLAEPGIRVDKVLGLHLPGPLARLGVDAFENPVHLLDEFCSARIWLEGGPVQRVNIQVPRPELFKTHLLGAFLVDFFQQGEHQLLDALVEGFAVGGGVVEPVLREENVVDKVLAVGVPGDFLADFEQLIKSPVQGVLVLEAAFPHGPPGPFPQAPVCIFHVGRHLLHCLGLAFELHAHAAGNLLVGLDFLIFFGLQGNIVGGEQVQGNLHALEPFAELALESVLGRVGHQFLVQLVIVFVDDRLDVFYKVGIGLGRLFVLGVAGHGHVAAAADFTQHRVQLAPVQNPVP